MNVFGKQDTWFPLLAENLRHVDPEVITCIQDTERMNQGYDALVLLPDPAAFSRFELRRISLEA